MITFGPLTEDANPIRTCEGTGVDRPPAASYAEPADSTTCPRVGALTHVSPEGTAIMDIAERFRAACVFEAGWHDTDLLPSTLSRATASVLEVDAASISFFGGDHRVLLGASTPEATTAERWQYTIGEGPCISAFEHAAPVLADELIFARHWPTLHERVHAQTPYRAVVAVPLSLGATGISAGAIDLYFTAPQIPPRFDLAAASTVASLACAALLQATLKARPALDAAGGGPAGEELTLPSSWLDESAARGRHQVWVAVGITDVVLGIESPEAFALLRAHAYLSERTLDELADDIVNGKTSVADLYERHP